jgi:perosamine synthetase
MGYTVMTELIPHSRPTITEPDVSAMQTQLASEWIACGNRTAEFEERVSSRHGYQSSTCVNSGSEALRLILTSAGIGAGDEVLLSTYVCSSVLDAVLSTGATPVFYDIDQAWRPSVTSITDGLTRNSRALILVHIFGIDGSSTELTDIPVTVIDDLCQAYGLHPRHSRRDAAFMSFSATKCITTGEGGALAIGPKLGAGVPRVKSTLSDLQASLGISQDSQYEEFLLRRKQIADFYLSEMPEEVLQATNEIRDSTCWYRFPVTVSMGFVEFSERMKSFGVAVRRGVDALIGSSFDGARTFRTAEAMFEVTASVPIYPTLTDGQIQRICDATRASVRS